MISFLLSTIYNMIASRLTLITLILQYTKKLLFWILLNETIISYFLIFGFLIIPFLIIYNKLSIIRDGYTRFVNIQLPETQDKNNTVIEEIQKMKFEEKMLNFETDWDYHFTLNFIFYSYFGFVVTVTNYFDI